MIKRLLKSVREFKKDALLTPFFVVLEVVMEVIIPLVMALLIDKGIDGQDMAAIWKYGIILVLCAMLALVFGAAAGTFAARASTGFARNLRHDMYYNVQNFSFSNIDKFSTGSIVTRLTTDVTNVQNAFQMCTRIAVRCPVMLAFALFMAMKINSRMALVFLAVLPILAIGMGILMKVVGPVFERAFKIYDRMNTVVQENVRGIRVVKTYVREDHETEKFEGVSGMLYRTFSKAQKTMAGVMPLMQFCIVRVHAAHFVVRRASDRRRLDDHRRADRYVLLRDADPDEPDDGSDGFRYDHHGQGERRACCRNPR